MKRHELINWFIKRFGYARYLEIGVDNPSANFDYIQAAHKVGVDPNKNTTHRCTSDQFFAANTDVFDIVFVDGLHLKDQALRDVENSLRVLSDNGTIIMHDCHPYNRYVGGPVHEPGKSWYGTVWQAFAHLRATRADLDMRVINTDCGLGVVRRGRQELYTGGYDTWEDYVAHQNEMLVLTSTKDVPIIYNESAMAQTEMAGA